jgi:fused signal recognition particle receptor
MAIKWFSKKKTLAGDTEEKNQTKNEKLPPADIVDDLPGTSVEHHQKSGNAPPSTTASSGEAVSPGSNAQGISNLRQGLSKSRHSFASRIKGLFGGKTALDDDLMEDLEELLITSDVGIPATMALIEKLSAKIHSIRNTDQLKDALITETLPLLTPPNPFCPADMPDPYVVMVVGVNGVGKTTTLGKIAALYRRADKQVLIGAADTFRAAAIEQLTIWAERAQADIVKHKSTADPAAVAYDSVEAAVARGKNVVLIDTAGRLHTQVNLMQELKKIKRAISKKLFGAPHEILLVLDATTGQNALSQADLFHNALGVTDIALTKLDGTAKGGIVIAIGNTLKIPIKYIGVGEQLEDLQLFNPQRYAEALFL